MSLFDKMLRSDESLFKNEIALDFSYQPKVLMYREQEQRQIAASIQPLLQNRNGRNIFLFGKPGIGKTVAVKHVLKELEEKYDEAYCLYINCWQKNTTFKIIVECCDLLGYKFTQNKKTEELFKIVANMVNKKSAVFVFDEVDKVEDFDFLYTMLEQIYRRSIILITNHKEFLLQIDERIKSRLLPDLLEFRAYTKAETTGILEQRCSLAFHDNVWEPAAFSLIAEKAFQSGDMRSGLHLMKEAGLNAEAASSRKILPEHAQKALESLEQMSIKNSEDLEDETRSILKIVKESQGQKIGELFKRYQEAGGSSSYKTFQRKVQKLADNRFISVKKITGGSEGSTTIVGPPETKKLTEF